MINEDPTFLSRVLFSDEANFCNNGHVNRHNMHYWAVENPYCKCKLFFFNVLDLWMSDVVIILSDHIFLKNL